MAGLGAVAFDGNNGYGSAVSPSTLNTIVNAFTIEFWGRFPRNVGACFFVSKMPTAGAGFAATADATGRPRVSWGATGGQVNGATSSVPMADRDWHHWAFTKAGDYTQVFLDGAPVGEFTESTPVAMVATTAAVTVGARSPNTSPCGGQMCEVRIWNVARTESQIGANMNLRLTGTEEGLCALWPMDDDEGLQARELVTNAALGLNAWLWTQPPKPLDLPSDGGGTDPDLSNALADWLSSTDVIHADSLPKLNWELLKEIRVKIGFTETALDVQIGDLDAYLHVTLTGIEAGIARIEEDLASGGAGDPMTHAQLRDQLLAAMLTYAQLSTAEHMGITDALSLHDGQQKDLLEHTTQLITGHHEWSFSDPDLPAWSVTGDVNDHIDEALVLLQGDLNDHEESTVARINAHTSAESSRLEGAVNGHTDVQTGILLGAMAGETAVITGHIDEAVTAINANTDLQVAGAVTAINTHADELQAGALVALAGTEGRLADQATDNRAAINAHTTTEANRIIAAIPEIPESEADRIISEVNAETNRVGAAIIASNDNQTGILIAVQTALAAVTLTVNTILEKVNDIISKVTDITGLLNQIIAILSGAPAPPLTAVAVATRSFADTTYWEQSADFWDIEITHATGQTWNKPIPGGTHFRAMGWVAQRVQGKYLWGEPLAFSSQRVERRNMIPDGLLINVKPGCTGTATAYVYQ